METYKCKYFKPYELVSPDFYEQFDNPDMIYSIFDENALRILDMIRDWADVGLTVCNWYWGGVRTDSGFRTAKSKWGTKTSRHRKAMAFDVVSPKITTLRLWSLINANEDKLPCKIRIEKMNGGMPVNWLHFDTDASLSQKEKVYYFNA